MADERTGRRWAVDLAVSAATATAVTVLLIGGVFGGILALLYAAHARGLPVSVTVGDGGQVHFRSAHVARRIQFRRMPAEDRALEQWLRAQPGVERLEVRRVGVTDPEMIRLLEGDQAVEIGYYRRGWAEELVPPWQQLGYVDAGAPGPSTAASIDKLDATVNGWVVLVLLLAGLCSGLATLGLRRRWRRRTRHADMSAVAGAGSAEPCAAPDTGRR